jgi:hypothetical protein
MTFIIQQQKLCYIVLQVHSSHIVPNLVEHPQNNCKQNKNNQPSHLSYNILTYHDIRLYQPTPH